MHDVPRWVLRAALGFALVADRSALAAQYFAHPELQQEAVVGQQAAFLARTAQRELAVLYRDASDVEQRAAILALARDAFGQEPAPSAARVAALLAFMVEPRPVQWQTPATAIAEAHRWTRALAQARTVAQSGDHGVVPIPLSAPWAQRAEAQCAQRAPTAWLQTQLLGGKSCRTFVADVLTVVYPHVDPMRPTHLEAFNPTLAEDAQLLQGLARLRGVRALNPDLGPIASVREVLPGWSSLQLLRLLALASHNHALELRLLEHVVGQAADEAAAVRAGQQALSDLGHLYQLLSAFYGPAFDKPYHFHGAALVACELIARGYPRPVVAWTGRALGDVYERASANPVAEDVQLHEDGTRYGIAACAKERS